MAKTESDSSSYQDEKTQISLQGLRKEFDIPSGIEVAVDGVDLDIKEGDFVTLVGPSGCGKTTTLRCIAGLETATEGTLYLEGEEAIDTSPQDRDLAMVFQRIALYPHMTARENIEYPLKLAGMSREQRNERVETAAEIVQIDGLLDKYPGELSGGQQQRIAISRAIVREPVAFLMDEPMSDLDAKLKREMRKELSRIHKELNATIVYVTHDQEEAMTMSDKIAVMNDGQIEQVGHPENVYRVPNNTFVAQFIGSPEINLLDASVVDIDEDRAVVDVEDGPTLSFDVGEYLPEKAADDVKLGFRPRKVEAVPDADAAGIQTTVDLHEPLGDEVHMYLEGPQGEMRSVVPVEEVIPEGDHATILPEVPTLYLFNSSTGDRFARGHPDRTGTVDVE
ncbi:ABC transporter ATP-binding protein [Haloplanus halophilus]|uniref:ABC transporter ATP-binding protein n=1 Tax=Haloplanus halophilus TaxID=2949993 RepID=UPI0020404DCC|nr:ABC transporter ATP-binding protein [Haloplanus sp. GDY1]